jgi:hypothetical protein
MVHCGRRRHTLAQSPALCYDDGMLRRLSVLVVWCSASIAAADPEEAPVPCKVPAAGASITLQFRPEASVADLAMWIHGALCKNVVIDAAVPKAGFGATLLNPRKLTPKQALQLVVDAIEATGLVVVQKPDTIIVKLGPNTPRPCGGVPAGSAGAPSEGPASPETEAEAEALALALASGIRAIDETHYEVKQSLVDKMLVNPIAVAKRMRIVPAMINGKPAGLKLYAIRPSSAFARLGFRNGDTMVALNKHRLDAASEALEAYSLIRDAKKIEVELVRRGKPVTLVFTIAP